MLTVACLSLVFNLINIKILHSGEGGHSHGGKQCSGHGGNSHSHGEAINNDDDNYQAVDHQHDHLHNHTHDHEHDHEHDHDQDSEASV